MLCQLAFQNMKEKFHDVWYSFPVQLTILHFRNNQILILLWLVTILFVTGIRGRLFGLQYLFTDPEYLGSVNPVSFGFLGIAFGIFVMVWHMSTYLLSAFRFPFLASLSRPFTKFIINNFTIPIVGFICMLGSIIYLQRVVEMKSWFEVLGLVMGWLSGVMIMVIVITVFLMVTNKDYRTYIKHLKVEEVKGRIHIDQSELAYQKYASSDWKVHTYLSESLRPRLVRKVEHYPISILQKVYSQNHRIAMILLITGIFFLIALGFLGDNRYFRIPAGASIFLLFSVLMSLASAISFWFRKWRLPVFILLLVIINFITKNDKLRHINQVYGIDYQNVQLPYDAEKSGNNLNLAQLDHDKRQTKNILEKWHAKQNTEKPYAVFLCASGGGQRAGVWAIEVLDTLNRIADHKLMDMSVMMSGASGGVLGMAYYRAVFEKGLLNPKNYPYKRRFSKDMLNSLAFALVSNDIFPNLATFKYSGKSYFRDRGYAFEQQFNENTGGLLNRSLISIRNAEITAKIPMLFITPTIINDGRRLIISPLDASYMTITPFTNINNKLPKDGLEFRDFFKPLEADNLRFLSALRMNATYPFILPNVFLPVQPAMEIMDAGFGDNYGVSVAHRFIWHFREWLKESTAGIIIVQMSAGDTKQEKGNTSNKGILESLVSPLGFARTILKHQKYEQGNYLQSMYDYFGNEHIHVLPFNYMPQKANQRASMSFHLTQREKVDIHNSLNSELNKMSLKQFSDLIKK